MQTSNEITTEQEKPLMVNARLIQAEFTVDVNGNASIQLCRKIEIEKPDGETIVYSDPEWYNTDFMPWLDKAIEFVNRIVYENKEN